MWRVLLFLPALVLVWPVAAPAQKAQQPQSAPTVAEIGQRLEEVRRKHNLPALAAGIVRSAGLQVAACVGVRKLETDVVARLEDSFHLGSNTKPITAFLIALLVDLGLLDYDWSLERIFPVEAQKMGPEMKKITLAMLLTHRSGLPANYPGGWHSAPNRGTPRQQRAELLKKLHEVKLEYSPGEKYLYSNFGYTVVGAVAEKVANDSWENLLERKVFQPLGMKHMGHGPMGKSGGNLTQPWQHSARGKPVAPQPGADNPPIMGPAGRLHGPPREYARFLVETLRLARGEKGRLQPRTLKQFFTCPFPGQFYCLGGWIGRGANAQGRNLVLGHDGNNTMNHISVLLLPDRDLGAFVCTNHGGGSAGCLEMRDWLLKDLSR